MFKGVATLCNHLLSGPNLALHFWQKTLQKTDKKTKMEVAIMPNSGLQSNSQQITGRHRCRFTLAVYIK